MPSFGGAAGALCPCLAGAREFHRVVPDPSPRLGVVLRTGLHIGFQEPVLMKHGEPLRMLAWQKGLAHKTTGCSLFMTPEYLVNIV